MPQHAPPHPEVPEPGGSRSIGDEAHSGIAAQPNVAAQSSVAGPPDGAVPSSSAETPSVTEPSSVTERLAQQRQRLAAACKQAGRSPEAVRLLAVSKRHPPAAIEEAYVCGQRDFGENYVQELVDKAQALGHLPDIRWHLIGHLQSNKAKYVAPLVHSVQTVSSAKLAAELGKRVEQRREKSGPLEVLVEVNVGGEVAKSGCSPDQLAAVLDAVDAQATLQLRGLMTVPPLSERPSDSARFFEALVALQKAHGGQGRLPELSMGMSGDAEIAIACGATWVRLGTAIFGSRPAKGA